MREDELINIRGPEQIKVLVLLDALSDGVSGQFLEHEVDVDETVGTAIDQHNWGFDVACWLEGGVSGEDVDRRGGGILTNLATL